MILAEVPEIQTSASHWVRGSYGIGRVLRGVWYSIGSLDPLAFSVVAAVLILSALLACYLPARRAARVDPMAALSQD